MDCGYSLRARIMPHRAVRGKGQRYGTKVLHVLLTTRHFTLKLQNIKLSGCQHSLKSRAAQVGDLFSHVYGSDRFPCRNAVPQSGRATVSLRRILLLLIPVLLFASYLPFKQTHAGDDWQPINPEELKMTAEPKAPGASAIILYRQVDRDDQTYHEFVYERIKILTEEGRKYADVELPFVKGEGQVNNIKARTIRPDGSIANFDGKIYEKTIVKARGIKYLAKTFTLPDVQVGSIIEYRYISSWTEYRVYDSKWVISAELFTKHAKFTLKPNAQFAMRWGWQQLPPGAPAPVKEGSLVRLELNDVPAFEEEDYMPPAGELKAHVTFTYTDNPEKEQDKFWQKEGKSRFERADQFVDRKKAMQQAVSQIVSPSDTPEVKLQKIYARVQQVRNTSFEAEKSDAELKREKEKENKNVEDVWKNQYGYGYDITWLFLGLVRAAGFEAYPVYVSRRNVYFFNPGMMNPGQLDDTVVLVKTGGKDMFFDPGTAFTPFGYLPWAETSVQGLRLEKDKCTWVTTSIPTSDQSTVTRVADLKMTTEGTLEGKLTVTYSGLEAQWRRLEERAEDDTDKKKFLEDEIKAWVPVGSDATLTNHPEWKSSAPTLVAEFDFKAEGWASAAGHRVLIPVGLFSAREKHLFEHAHRVHPLYFEFPHETRDDVKVQLPLDWSVKSVPTVPVQDQKVILYSLKVEDQKGDEHITRVLKLDLLGVDQKYYGALRNFFQQVKTGDEQQIVVQPGS
jgi:transglutaminase-like putative cysteine protease